MNVVRAQAVPGQTYGQGTAQLAAQSAVPMGTPAAPSPAGAAQPGASAPPLPPVTPLTAPTSRPDEPVTSGLPVGPGPGPEALGLADVGMDELRAVYMRFPSEELRELIEFMEEEGI